MFLVTGITNEIGINIVKKLADRGICVFIGGIDDIYYDRISSDVEILWFYMECNEFIYEDTKEELSDRDIRLDGIINLSSDLKMLNSIYDVKHDNQLEIISIAGRNILNPIEICKCFKSLLKQDSIIANININNNGIPDKVTKLISKDIPEAHVISFDINDNNDLTINNIIDKLIN